MVSVLQLHASFAGCAELEGGLAVLGLNNFGEKLLFAHKHGANGFLDALRHATDMERGVIRSLRAGLLTF